MMMIDVMRMDVVSRMIRRILLAVVVPVAMKKGVTIMVLPVVVVDQGNYDQIGPGYQ